jgi:hypothetical protein
MLSDRACFRTWPPVTVHICTQGHLLYCMYYMLKDKGKSPWRRGIVVIAYSSRRKDPMFESQQSVRFLGLHSLHCFCRNLICIVSVCVWEILIIHPKRQVLYICMYVGRYLCTYVCMYVLGHSCRHKPKSHVWLIQVALWQPWLSMAGNKRNVCMCGCP